MEFNPELLAVHDDSQIAVVCLIGLLDRESRSAHRRIGIKIVDLRAVSGWRRRHAPWGIDDRFHIEAAVAGDNERHAVIVCCKGQFTGVAVVVVGVSGKNGVRVHALRLANGIDLAQHQRVADVRAAGASRPWRGRITEWGMMNGYQYRTGVVLRLDVLQLGGQESKLHVGNAPPFPLPFALPSYSPVTAPPSPHP